MKLNKKQKSELRYILNRLDWIKILDRAIRMRPTSWAKDPVREYRNASDEILFALEYELEKKGLLDKFTLSKKEIERFKRVGGGEKNG